MNCGGFMSGIWCVSEVDRFMSGIWCVSEVDMRKKEQAKRLFTTQAVAVLF